MDAEPKKNLDITELWKTLQAPEAPDLKVGIPLVQMVMDYDNGDLAESEIKQQLCRVLPSEWQLQLTRINSFKTTETGFAVAQLALRERTSDDPPLVLYVNTAPRRDARKERVRNEGEGLVYGKLKNGVEVVAVNSGYSLSLLRDEFESLYAINTMVNAGSQFRSRDNFPAIIGAVAQGIDFSDWLGPELDPLDPDIIPESEAGFIGYIDSFGNIKTTYRSSHPILKDLKPGQEVEIKINSIPIVAKVATGSFMVAEGNFAFAPGSSGGEDRFYEIFQRGSSAAVSFKNPQVGSRIEELKPLPIEKA